jgi:hypothetical protein
VSFFGRKPKFEGFWFDDRPLEWKGEGIYIVTYNHKAHVTYWKKVSELEEVEDALKEDRRLHYIYAHDLAGAPATERLF